MDKPVHATFIPPFDADGAYFKTDAVDATITIYCEDGILEINENFFYYLCDCRYEISRTFDSYRERGGDKNG